MLTTAQSITLKAAILSETDTNFVANRVAGATGAMANFYNVVATPDYFVWRSYVPESEFLDNYVFTEMDNLTQPKQYQLDLIMKRGGCNPSRLNVRAGLAEVFKVAGLSVTKAAILLIIKRKVTRGEKLYAIGAGTSGTPSDLVFEGNVRNEDIVQALAS